MHRRPDEPVFIHFFNKDQKRDRVQSKIASVTVMRRRLSVQKEDMQKWLFCEQICLQEQGFSALKIGL
jgi:hypothetical protein